MVEGARRRTATTGRGGGGTHGGRGRGEEEKELSSVYYLIDAVTCPLLFIVLIGLGSQAN